jgi:hypothetical protein
MVAFIRLMAMVNCTHFGLYTLLRVAEPRSVPPPLEPQRTVGFGFTGLIIGFFGFKLKNLAFFGINLGSLWLYLGSFWVRFFTIVNNDGHSLGSFFQKTFLENQRPELSSHKTELTACGTRSEPG